MEREYNILQSTEQSVLVNDAIISSRLKEFFQKTILLEAEDIEISCQKGIVTLIGLVASLEERMAAEAIAKEIEGVQKVINKIKTRPNFVRESAYWTCRLEKVLLRNPRTIAHQIKIQIKGKRAILGGQVYSVEAREVAKSSAALLLKDKTIINDLAIMHH